MRRLRDRRESNWATAESGDLDVIVVGGGINGVGIALDAVTRGLRTMLVERTDLAVGTSRRSSKLIHGGLRYLEQFRFGLVREALAERQTLLRLAPHLVRMERFIFPVFTSAWETPYIATGMSLHDALGGRRGGRSRLLRAGEAESRIPVLRSDMVRADARIVLEDPHRGESAAELTAGMLAEALEWSHRERASAVLAFRRASELEYGLPSKTSEAQAVSP